MAEALAVALQTRAFEVVACVASGHEAMAAIRRLEPAVAVVDVVMPELGGLRIAHELASTGSGGTAVVLYADQAERALIVDAVEAQARGFVLKQSPLEELVRAIEAAGRGETYLDPRLGDLLARGVSGGPRELTNREREVLRLLANGSSNEEVGRELAISPDTVRTYLRRAMAKLEADTRTHAVALALRRSIIS
ncbi:MAG: response regulator transcription factor [Gaiellaceae bacterium]